MIHEGTHGIQALDLLGRKVLMNEGQGMELMSARITSTIERAKDYQTLVEYARALDNALRQLRRATHCAWAGADPEAALANATPYLQAFGHVVVGWIWLDVAIAAHGGGPRADLRQGLLAACRYFVRWELPRIAAWLKVVEMRDDTCRMVEDAWF
jgi:Acetyl-CoA dehydrogenase C-terminal like